VLHRLDGGEFRAARRHGQSHQCIVAGQHTFSKAANVGGVRQRAFPHPALRLGAGLAVCVDGASSHFAQRADRFVGMIG
jgi:hypothetical protein